MSADSADWKVECSDDENYGLTYSELCNRWVPDASTTSELFSSYTSEKDCSLLKLEWVCPGRKEIKSEADQDADQEDQKAEEKSDFDFLDEFNNPSAGGAAKAPGGPPGRRLGPGTVNKAPRGSAKKKTTSLDGILSSMRRHRKLDQQGEAKQQSPQKPK